MSRPRAAHFEDPQAPIQRSPNVLFAPPASPSVPQEDPPTSPPHSHKLCYFDFTLALDGKKYSNIQVSVSHDRILITAFETMPPVRTCTFISPSSSQDTFPYPLFFLGSSVLPRYSRSEKKYPISQYDGYSLVSLDGTKRKPISQFSKSPCNPRITTRRLQIP